MTSIFSEEDLVPTFCRSSFLYIFKDQQTAGKFTFLLKFILINHHVRVLQIQISYIRISTGVLLLTQSAKMYFLTEGNKHTNIIELPSLSFSDIPPKPLRQKIKHLSYIKNPCITILQKDTINQKIQAF